MIEHEQKETFVQAMKADLAKASGVIFVDYTGLTVAEVEQLRRKTRAGDVKYRVVKNTLMKRALEGTSAQGAADLLKGTPTGVMLGYSDPVTAAKIAVDFAKTSQHLKIKGGLLENKLLSAKETEELSKMANRRELLAQVIGMALGTGRRLVAQIKSPAGRIVGAINKLAEKSEDKSENQAADKPEEKKA